MDFNPSPSQQILISTARAFLRQHCSPELAAASGARRARLRRGALAAPGRARWPGCSCRPISAAAVAPCSTSYCSSRKWATPACPARSWRAPSWPRRWCSRWEARRSRSVCSLRWRGERLATLALVEETGSFDPGAVALDCRVPGRLTGRSSSSRMRTSPTIWSWPFARVQGSAAPSSDRSSGITRVALDTLSGEKLFELAFDGVEVGADDRLGSAGRAREALASALQAGALARTAEMVGAAQHVLELVVEHAKTRVQGTADRRVSGHPACLRRSRARRSTLRARSSRPPPGGPPRDCRRRPTWPWPRRTPAKRAWRWPGALIRSSARSATARSTRST